MNDIFKYYVVLSISRTKISSQQIVFLKILTSVCPIRAITEVLVPMVLTCGLVFAQKDFQDFNVKPVSHSLEEVVTYVLCLFDFKRFDPTY